MAAFKFSDGLLLFVNILMAVTIFSQHKGSFSIDHFFQMQFKVIHFIAFFAIILLWHALFSILDLYNSRRLLTLKREIKDILKATILGTMMIYMLLNFLQITSISLLMLITFWIGSASTTVLTRIALRSALKWVRLRGRNLRYVLIVGTNSRALEFARKVESRPELGYVVLGFVDSLKKACAEDACSAFGRSKYRIVSDFTGFSDYLKNNVVDEVVISLPVKSFYQETVSTIKACERQGIVARHLTNIFNTKGTHFRLDQIEDESLFSHYTHKQEPWQVLAKWTLDKVLSLIGLLIISPLLLITAVLIKIFSPGPIFFVQERVGLNKRIFKLYKFRTMRTDAEKVQAEIEHLNEASGPVFKIKNDPRITPIGKFLRTTSIDELPQLLNVLKGDMSIVGPRPLPLRDVRGFDKDSQRRRFSVRPGITCLWQVNGRSAVSFDRWMQLDNQYIDQWSLWLDFKILAKTLPVVLIGSGAS
jgi:exopolysaccharide biosynthesis polyprenyl glycosylphosphotransferase